MVTPFIKIAKYKTGTGLHQICIAASDSLVNLGNGSGDKIQFLSSRKNQISFAISDTGNTMSLNEAAKNGEYPWRLSVVRSSFKKIPSFGMVSTDYTVKGNIITIEIPVKEQRPSKRKMNTKVINDPFAKVKKSIDYLNGLKDPSISFDVDENGEIFASVVQKIRL